jgi:hypothetical protein
VHDSIAQRNIPDLDAMMLRGIYMSASLHRTGTSVLLFRTIRLYAPQEPHGITQKHSSKIYMIFGMVPVLSGLPVEWYSLG